ncbi:GNAT family N-acetyltransferase [Legionella oakridgensis]|nr:GNAT family N-acetyltransferase [Legionella oakridgensis]KTD37318.1 GNAT family acetyltransferase [Legionella oakridgensis]STY15770.1 acyl-CoA N-acyltransferase [Legionella longbeachae]
MSQIKIRLFSQKDIAQLVDEFARHHWPKPKSTFELYWHEQTLHERTMWVAFYKDQLAGYATLKWDSCYQLFREKKIPEIMDLNVLPPYRNKGIGSQLLEMAEQLAATRSDVVGLGVGLYRDYGNAQKLYIKKGYSPDGYGLTYQYQEIKPGSSVPVDDDLVLWFTKKLKSSMELDVSTHLDQKPLETQGKCQIRFVEKIDEATEKKMTKDLIAYEARHGIDVNYQRFSVVISNENEQILGVINAYTAFAEIYVDDIWVDSAYRGKGYGRQLLSALENHFKGQGFNNINLVTSAFQAPEFYKKCGFTAEFTRINKKNPKLSKTFFVKFFNEDSEMKGILKSAFT